MFICLAFQNKKKHSILPSYEVLLVFLMILSTLRSSQSLFDICLRFYLKLIIYLKSAMMMKSHQLKITRLDQLDPQQYYEKIMQQIGKRKIKNSYQKQTRKQEPDNIIEYLEDWIGKIIQDGHPIQIFFQLLFQNSHKQEGKQWLGRFLQKKKVGLFKRNLKPRLLVPKIYIQKDQNEVKEMVKQIYSWTSNEHGLNLIMKTDYKWRNLNWKSIESQLKRNRYICKLLNITRQEAEQNIKDGINNSFMQSGSGENVIQQQIGLLFTNLIMLNNIRLYGDSIYVLVYESHFNQRDQKDTTIQQVKLNIAIGFVLTQYLLPVIVFHGLISNQMEQSFQSYLHTIVITTIMDWCRNNKYVNPFHFIFYYSPGNTKNQVSNSTNTKLLKLNCHQRVFLTSIHIARQKINEPNIQPGIYVGPFSPLKKDNFLQIYYRLHSSVWDRKDIDFHTLIEKINDRCRLVTIMIKIGLILQKESVNKRESAMQFLLVGTSDQLMGVEGWELKQLKNLRQIIYSKQILKIMRDIIKDAINYRLNKRMTCIRDKKQIKVQLFAISNTSECISLNFSIQNHRWECQCQYIYKSGLPCPHIVRVLHQFKGDISYYISERWKNPQPEGKRRKQVQMVRNNEREPVTRNKGLARLVNLYRRYYNQQII